MPGSWYVFVCFQVFLVAGIEPMAWHVLGECSTTQAMPQHHSCFVFFGVGGYVCGAGA
jgi:hypothetical protein